MKYLVKYQKKILFNTVLNIIFSMVLAGCGAVTPASTSTGMPALTETPGPPFQYWVRNDDESCSSLAETFKVTVESIIELNNLASSCAISENQLLLIPYSSALGEIPSPIPYPTRVEEQYPKFSFSGYMMVFSKYNDIYLQDGNHVPVKINRINSENDGEVEILALSDDHQKVVFHTDRETEVVRSINVDGTNTGNLYFPPDQAELGSKLGAVTFIPGTHQFIIESLVCKWEEGGTPCFASLFFADADTSEVKRIAYLGLADQKYSHNLRELPKNIVVSPDGKMIAVGMMSGVTIYGMDGGIIRENILPYSPGYRSYGNSGIFPRLAWLPDSKELIVGLPDAYKNSDSYVSNGTTLWRYTIANDDLIQIKLEPLQVDYFKISSDGEWLLYLDTRESWVSRMNLLDGRVQNPNGRFSVYDDPFVTDDDQYFVTSGEGASMIQPIDFIPTDRTLIVGACWIKYKIDDHHYVCSLPGSSGKTGVIEISSQGISTYLLALNKDISSFLISPK